MKNVAWGAGELCSPRTIAGGYGEAGRAAPGWGGGVCRAEVPEGENPPRVPTNALAEAGFACRSQSAGGFGNPPRVPMKIEAVFLDLGNVLAFHDDAALCRRLSEYGGAPPERIRERLLALWDPFNRGTVAGDDLRRAVSEASGATTAMDPNTFFQVWTCHFRIHHEVLPLVESLLGRVKVALLSNTNEIHWRFVRPLLPVVERFADRVLSCELGLAKPDPEIFRVALRRVGSPAQACAYFDDVPLFVEAARSLGIAGQVFTTAARFREQLAELGLAP
jgi:FMN phosphatase YigB (HAD superfamily)